MDCGRVKKHIVTWLDKQLKESKQKGFVIGVSGGVDSALVSTLCCETGHPVLCISMPINQHPDHISRADKHMDWLKKTYKHVKCKTIDLSIEYMRLEKKLIESTDVEDCELGLVNTRSRIRMLTLYFHANVNGYLVIGTGNKIEDFGVGFFTKGGDGQIDISPIGDMTKTEVWELAKYLWIEDDIIAAKPTDGLWEDGRTDEDSIGASYLDLEKAMEYCLDLDINTWSEYKSLAEKDTIPLMDEKVLKIYLDRHEANAHKMKMPPVCKIPEYRKEM